MGSYLQAHHALDAGLLRFRRIFGIDLGDAHVSRYRFRYSHAARRDCDGGQRGATDQDEEECNHASLHWNLQAALVSDTVATVFVPARNGHELCDCFEHRLGLVAVCGVAAVGERENLDQARGLARD